MLLIFLFLTFCFITIILFFKIYIKTSTMAMIMALGIIIQGVLANFFQTNFIHSSLSDYFICILIALWISFFFSVWMTIFKDKFRSLHYDDYINRFGIGTWIAASSICGITINTHFNELGNVTTIIGVFNICIWLVYIFISLKTLYQIYQSGQENKVHGILLLTTVSTQSMVLLLSSYGYPIPFAINLSMIIIGLTLYLISLLFIMRRYRSITWSIENDWNNTNCIIHGALSISGLACLVSNTSNGWFVEAIWTSTFVLFLIVESIEIYRLYRRLSKYGMKSGILIYNVTQWSRIFTFAMFYTFTFLIKSDLWYIHFLKPMIMYGGIWIILSLTVLEVVLLLMSVVGNSSKKYLRMH